ncbi:MAG: NAD(P)/FAD-dependent oxidoreductase [Pseudomonadota bacterium]
MTSTTMEEMNRSPAPTTRQADAPAAVAPGATTRGAAVPADLTDTTAKNRIIVIGGGAGGLELVVKLARKLRRDASTEVLLVDKNPTHIWKPLFHEVATGSMDSAHDEASYRMLARKHRFRFMLGTVTRVDLENQQVLLDEVHDSNGQAISPRREIPYSQLVVCVGSHSNDFGIPGVREFSRQLDSREQAEQFHKHFAAQFQRVNYNGDPNAVLSVVIVGGGATGVELAAEMHNVVQRLREYGFEDFSQERLKVTVVEAAPGLLPRLAPRIGISVKAELEKIGVAVRVGTTVSRVNRDTVETSDGQIIDADISVWAAGVKAPAWLAECGFPTDRLGRIEVSDELVVKGVDNVLAVGDCCGCRARDGSEIPPRAQAAHQMAAVAVRNVLALRSGKSLKRFVYRDFGSIVNLSRFSTVGNLMGNLMRGTVFIEGWVARLVYLSLYRLHQAAIHGRFSTLLIMLGDRIYKSTRAEVKLH